MVTDLPSIKELQIPSLDGLRGLAACMVLVSHVSNVTGLWGGLFGSGGGQVGVMVFFVLSGYLISGLYLDRSFTTASVQDYLIRRAARVLPMFYFIVTIALVLHTVQSRTGLLVSIYPVSLDQAFWHYAILSGASVLWTIPVEIHFYLLFIGVWWLRTRIGNVWLGAICVSAMVFYWALPVQVPDRPRVFPYYLVFFLAGMLVERLLPMRRQPTLSWPWSWILAPAAALPFLIYPNIWLTFFNPSGWLARAEYQQMWHDPLSVMAVSALLIAALLSRPIKALLSTRIMIYLGTISYSMYLLHHPVIDMLAIHTSLRAHPIAFLLATFSLTAGLASLTYFGIERRFWRRGSYRSVRA
ncbi:acyltransferase [Bradyrhizobium sp. OAE829]|uniref:acyltransferase family protein n=1 Tax=Bradyrhizobium sp. OAE829 TaxID=2663807 RepID=UPI001AEEB8D9